MKEILEEYGGVVAVCFTGMSILMGMFKITAMVCGISG